MLLALTQHGACSACGWDAPVLQGSPKPPHTFPGRRRLWGFQGHLTQPHPCPKRTLAAGFSSQPIALPLAQPWESGGGWGVLGSHREGCFLTRPGD